MARKRVYVRGHFRETEEGRRVHVRGHYRDQEYGPLREEAMRRPRRKRKRRQWGY